MTASLPATERTFKCLPGGPELLADASRQPQPSVLRLPINFPLFLSKASFPFHLTFPDSLPTFYLPSNRAPITTPSFRLQLVSKMASSQHGYDDSDSDGGNFNPAPADLSDDEQQPTSPVESRNGARRSSQSRDDNDADGDANGDSHSVNGREDNESDNEDDSGARKAARDDDEDGEEEDEEEEEDEDEDDEDMPVRELASGLCPPDSLLGLRSVHSGLSPY